MHERMKSEISVDFGREIVVLGVPFLSGMKRPTRFPPVEVVAKQEYSLLALLTCLARPVQACSRNSPSICLHLTAAVKFHTCASESHIQPALHGSTPQLTLRYDSRHYHGSSFLRQLERSAEMSKSASSDPRLRKTSSLDLHMPERSSQADATSIDDMHIVYPHTHSITTSSTASAGEQVKDAENKYFCQCLLSPCLSMPSA